MRTIINICLIASFALLCCTACRAEDVPDSPKGAAALSGKKFIVCGNSMIYYGGLVQNGSQKQADPGMLSRILSANGVENFEITDCTYGGHHLKDFGAEGCVYSDKHGDDGKTPSGGCSGLGNDLIGGLDLASYDYVIISEAGNNYSSFYKNAKDLFGRFSSVNKDVKLVYINHIYSVYKDHKNVLDNLKTLHDSLGVTIVNCGQLAYDIYTGKVKITDSKYSYTDRYTFTNHTDSDTYHPNPLMGYIMTQMLYCALTGELAEGFDFLPIVKNCKYASGSVSYSSYYGKYYTTEAKLPFTTVIANKKEMNGIQQLIPFYIDRF